MRRWLKANGYQDKPLIVSEFGIPKVIRPTPLPSIGEDEAETFFFEQVMPWMENYTDPRHTSLAGTRELHFEHEALAGSGYHLSARFGLDPGRGPGLCRGGQRS